MDVGEPLLLIGSCNDWQLDVARRQHCLTPVDFGSSEQSQESVLRLEVPKGGLEFQIISAVSTWKWRLHPCSDLHSVLQRDMPEHVPVRLSRGSNSEAAHGLNFILDAPPGRLVDVRVLLSTRFGICVWYSNSTVGLTTQEAACPPTAAAAPASKRRPESPAALKRTAERVGAFSAFKQRNQPQSMDAFQRGGTPMAPRPKQRSTPGAFSRAVATPTAAGTAEPRAFRPVAARPPKRVVRLTLEEAKDLLEALRRVCSHQTFRRELDTLRRRDLGAFKKRQAMARLLGQWWKEQLRESGFTIDEHGFPQMLEAVQAHRDSAGVDIVSREVERLLGFPPGAVFGARGNVEVTLRHVSDGDEVTVSVPERCALLAVREALATKLRRPELLKDCRLAVRGPDGELEALRDELPLHGRRSLLVEGASISCAELAAASAAAEGEAARRVAGELAAAAAARRAAQAAPVSEAPPRPPQPAAPPAAPPPAAAPPPEAAAPRAPEPAPEAAAKPARVWKVVGGGGGKGGIIVREDVDLKSAELPRLQRGAEVRELERLGNRLRFQKLQGAGPESGWVNVMLKENVLLKLLEREQN